MEINVLGDVLENDNALIVSNHQSIVDHVIFHYLTLKTINNRGNDPLLSSKLDEEQEEEYPLKRLKEQKMEAKVGKKRLKWNKDINGIEILKNEQPFFAKNLYTMITPEVKFFTWFEIWNIPTISLFKHISQTDENWELDGETLVSIFQKFLDSSKANYSQWLTLFPEVNIFNEKNSKMQNILGEKHYLPYFENVLYPRFGAFANAVGGLYKTKFTRIYDMTLLYYNKNKTTGEVIDFNAPTLLGVLGLRDENIKTVILVFVAGKFLGRIPLKRNRLEKYLENRWIKKDKLITKLQKKIIKENELIIKEKQKQKDVNM